jgi:hypothetical protein
VLPNFLVIGAMKAGTTSLWQYLRGHPDVFMPDHKEIQFFSEHDWWRGLDWYEQLFSSAGTASAVGEASPSYSRYPNSAEAADRIAEVLPEAKLLYVIRHPLDRIVSQYWHEISIGLEHRPIDEAVLDERRYVSTSLYAMQAERYLERFTRDQLLIFTSEALERERAMTMAQVFGFLGVDDGVQPRALDEQYGRAEQRRRAPAPIVRLKRSRSFRSLRAVVPPAARQAAWRAVSRPVSPPGPRPELAEPTRAELVERLRPDLARLVGLVGDGFGAWGLLDD